MSLKIIPKRGESWKEAAVRSVEEYGGPNTEAAAAAYDSFEGEYLDEEQRALYAARTAIIYYHLEDTTKER